MGAYRLLILTAILPEAQALARRLKLKKIPAKLPFWTGNEVALAVVGLRANRLPMLLQIPELESFSAAGTKGAIVMAGLAGGLASELHLGAVVIDGKGLPSRVTEGARLGLIHTSDHIVATSAEKAKLLAGTGCVAVDMETAIVRRFAAKRGAGFVSIRAISDTARDALNPELLTLINEDGKPLLGRAVKMILHDRKKLRELLALRRMSSLALGHLATTVELLVASGWPGASTKRPAAI